MAEATPFALTRLYSDLLDRRISVTDASDLTSSDGKKAYAIYDVVGRGAQVFLQVDFELLGSLGGALAGLPNVLVKERLKLGTQDETLCDAMYEVLNITSAAITTEDRAVLQRMELEESKGNALARELARLRMAKSRFLVIIPSYTGGQMACYSPYLNTPVHATRKW
jgi:hypothetical protein